MEDENWESQIWRPLDGEVGWFIIDLGCQQSYDTVRERANKGDSLISYFHDMIYYNVPTQSPCKVYDNPFFESFISVEKHSQWDTQGQVSKGVQVD